MNICIINIDSKPEFIGGIKRVSSILGNEWMKTGHTVCFMSYCTSSLRYKEIASIPQYFLPDNNQINSDENYQHLCDFVRDNHIDIIINQHIENQEVSKLCFKVKETTKVKVISTLHFSPRHKEAITKNSFFARYKLGNIYKRYFIDAILWLKFQLITKHRIKKDDGLYFKYIYNNSDRIVLLSDKFISSFKKKAKLTDFTKLIAINNPSIIQQSDVTPKEKMVVWCGRLGYDMKRVDKMLSIWRKISSQFPDWQLKVLGSGDANYFIQVAQKFQIPNVEFIGFCDPVPYYTDAAILCMTSVTEGWGMVLIEAQSYGCVPIAYNSFDSLSDIITDGENGFTVKAFDETEYVQKLTQLMSSPSLRLKMAEKGMKSIQRFDASKIAQQWIIEFEKLMHHQ